MSILIKNNTNTIVSAAIILLVFLFIGSSGTMTSGFHFVDDHEVLTIDKELQINSLFSVTGEWLKTDIKGNARFRPVYIIHRIAETKMFGTNFVLWSVYNGLLFAIAMISFYMAARKLKFNIYLSLIFITAVFIGPQVTVLWRLGPGEGLAMTFFGLSFLFMTLSIGRSRAGKNNLMFILFLILAALTKESFLLAIPAVLYLKLSFEARSSRTSLVHAAIGNIVLLIPLVIMAAGLAYIFIFVGTGYASAGQSLNSIIVNVIYSILKIGKIYLFQSIFVVTIFIFGVITGRTDYLKSMIESIVFLLLLAVPNIILYSSTGLEERYLLPSTVGLAYLIISVPDNFKTKSQLLVRTIILASFITFIPQFISAGNSAEEFTNDGRETGILLKSIAHNAISGKQVLLIADPVESYEISVSLKTWLSVACDIKLLGYALVKENETEANKAYVDGWNSYFKGNLFGKDGTPPGLLIFLNKDLRSKLAGSSVADFEGKYKLETETAHFVMYVLK